jgi:hypothetical protein
MPFRRIDAFPRNGLGAVSRRDIVRALTGSGAAGLGGALSLSAHGKGNGRKKGGKGKGKRKPSPKPRRDICDATWPDAHNREYCKFIRRQCDGDDPREFCIEEGFDGRPGEKVAVCCEIDRKCCGKACCLRDAECCGGLCCGRGADSDLACCDGRCIDTTRNPEHCGVCGNECGIGETCLDSRCVSSCGPGGTACPGTFSNCCPAGRTCCNGRCIDTTGDDNNCGQCGNRCRKPGYPRNEVCIDGECVCWAAGTVWDDSCGGCNDPATWKCCDIGGSACPVTHDCVLLGTRPNGDPIWGCVGRRQQTT